MRNFKGKLEQVKKDKEQFRAYLSNQNTVVFAGPGSGKTTVLTLKIMKLLRDNISQPRGLACVTFSTQATREIKQRLDDYGFINRKNIFIGTVHSFCLAEVIAPFAQLYPEHNIPIPVKIITTKERQRIFKKIISDFNFEGIGIRIEDMDKERRLNIAGLSQVNLEPYEVALKVATEYEQRIHSLGYMDYEDIIKYATILIQKEIYVRACLEAKFPWFLVDEYQDLGKPLHEMVLSLVEKTNIKVFAVGDPDQSIYGFQGAIPDYLLELCQISTFLCIRLKTNYRSNQDIIEASEIALKQQRNYIAGIRLEEKAKFDFIICQHGMSDQYDAVISEVIPKYLSIGIPLEEIAIMVSNKYELQELATKMEESGYPYFVVKQNFDRSDIVRWLEDCAKWLDREQNVAITFTGISDFWINLLLAHRLINPTYDEFRIQKTKLFKILQESNVYIRSIGKWLGYIINNLGLIEIIEKSERYPEEKENLLNLIQTSQEEAFAKFDISRFANLGKPDNQITITTRHSSKGLEFEAVIILGLEEEVFPSYRALNDVKLLKNERKLKEERRIFFVCVSRAKWACCLVRSKTRTISTRNGPWTKSHMPSRFWKEIYDRFSSTENTYEYLG